MELTQTLYNKLTRIANFIIQDPDYSANAIANIFTGNYSGKSEAEFYKYAYTSFHNAAKDFWTKKKFPNWDSIQENHFAKSEYDDSGYELIDTIFYQIYQNEPQEEDLSFLDYIITKEEKEFLLSYYDFRKTKGCYKLQKDKNKVHRLIKKIKKQINKTNGIT